LHKTDPGADLIAFEAAPARRRQDFERETFDDGGLADTRFAGEDRVVLPAAREDIDDLANLEIAADDSVELAGLRLGREIVGD